MQMQQAMLAVLTQQHQPAAAQMPFSFQLPPPSLTYRFPPPPSPHFSPDQPNRPIKQQKCNETTQQKRNVKPYDCASPPTQTPNRTTRQTTKKQNSNSSPSVAGTPADISRAPQATTNTTDTTMELEQH
ncbi:unnamed protein product [Didymodactylos carnosus]|uniref:Uncharacterized protein n=1 Tax=Didymodactylos carnosus TaxID=1234261 RepID=A0A815ZAL2_9BILA|nr:unnamed protein product [Didymodactylos carnosus]CAF4449998.1 unnamed protein product [Didymodactylos carnosus]